jgi:mono/diheme cytochrome c family protein
MQLAAIDKELAEQGEELFKINCSACHKLDERYVGPAQRDLVERRSPEYIMNMILNPAEMLEKHPEAKKMLAKFMTPMPNQNVNREEARAILEYFRYMDANKDKTEVD